MGKHNYSNTARFFGLILVVGILIYYIQGYSPIPAGKLLENNANILPIKESLSTDTTYVQLVREYLECGHEVILEERHVTPGQWASLLEEFPGFQVKELIGLTILLKQEPGLCPMDKKKRYLGIVGDYVGIFKDTSYAEQELERVTQIRVDQLPEEWQVQLRQGSLEFDSEVSLLEALDSFDEYQAIPY